MKTILLIPVKNESWIIEDTLQNMSPHVDIIIVADQNSTDSTLEICKKFKNVEIINNPYEGHSNKVRWLLLDEARKYGNNNLIICLDADELISPEAIKEMKKLISDNMAHPGDIFKLQWIQLWRTVKKYRNDGVWKNNFKNVAFIDNANINEYEKSVIINDHTSRVPNSNPGKEFIIDFPILHFHFVALKRNQIKQAWYRCHELIEGKRNAKRINNTYRVTLIPKKIKEYDVPSNWYTGLSLPENIDEMKGSWHLEEIMKLFDRHGILFFEELQIWHIEELEKEFEKNIGRKPVSKTYPVWLSIINEVKNKIKNLK